MKAKVCPICKEEKPLSEFYKYEVNTLGVGSYCKVCDKKRSLEWYRDNREKALERQKKYDDAHREQIMSYKRDWAKKKKESTK